MIYLYIETAIQPYILHSCIHDTDCRVSGTTASAHSSSEAHSVHPWASSSPSSSSSEEHGPSGQDSALVPEERGKNVTAYVHDQKRGLMPG